MSNDDIIRLAEVLKGLPPPQKKQREPSTVVIFIVLSLIIGTWAAITVSWFLRGDYPAGLVSFTQWLKVALMGQTGLMCVERCVKYYKQNGRGEGGGIGDH